MYDGGRDPPLAFFERPEVLRIYLPIWEAFGLLGTERQIGMTVGPIPYSAIVRHVDKEMELDGQAAEFVIEVLYLVDRKYMALLSSRRTTRTVKGAAYKAKMSDPAEVSNLMMRFMTRQRLKKQDG